MSSTNELSTMPVVDIFDNEGKELPTKSAHIINIELGENTIEILVGKSRVEERKFNDVLVKDNGEIIEMVNPKSFIQIKKHQEEKQSKNKKVRNINSEKIR